jgi:hypothetical protein
MGSGAPPTRWGGAGVQSCGLRLNSGLLPSDTYRMTLALALTVAAVWVAVSLVVVGLCASAARGDESAARPSSADRVGPVALDWQDLAA